MDTIQANNSAGRMNAQELCRDYAGRMNATTPLVLSHHEEDESGSTLVIHLPARGIEEQAAKAKLGERLGKLIADFPAAESAGDVLADGVNGDAVVLEDAKAVVDTPQRTAKRSKKTETTNDEPATTGT